MFVMALLRSGEADNAIGSEMRGKRDSRSMNLITVASNQVVSFPLSPWYGGDVTDVRTGYWAFDRNTVERLPPRPRSTQFEIEMEMFFKAKKDGLAIEEAPVGFRRRVGYTRFSFWLRMRNLHYALKYIVSAGSPE